MTEPGISTSPSGPRLERCPGIVRITNTEDGRIVYVGLIDLLTHYGMRKRMETFVFSVLRLGADISCQPPGKYARRFRKFRRRNVFEAPDHEEGGAQHARDPSAAVAAAAAAVDRYLPRWLLRFLRRRPRFRLIDGGRTTLHICVVVERDSRYRVDLPPARIVRHDMASDHGHHLHRDRTDMLAHGRETHTDIHRTSETMIRIIHVGTVFLARFRVRAVLADRCSRVSYRPRSRMVSCCRSQKHILDRC